DLHLLIAAGLLQRLHEAQMRDVIDARAHRQTHWPISGACELPDILAAEVRRERPIVLRAEAADALAMPDRRPNCLKLEDALVHRVFLEYQPDADDAVRAEQVCFLFHASHRQLARFEHGLRQHIELLAHAPALPLEADVIDRRSHDEAERLETGLLDEEEFIDGQVAR